MRDLKNMNQEDAKKSGWDVLKPMNCEVVGKAVFGDEKTNTYLMKSTKRFAVPGGWIYNTTTEMHKNDQHSIAEALAFVPDVNAKDPDPRKSEITSGL